MALAFHAKATWRPSGVQRSVNWVYCQLSDGTLTAANFPDGADQVRSSAPVTIE